MKGGGSISQKFFFKRNLRICSKKWKGVNLTKKIRRPQKNTQKFPTGDPILFQIKFKKFDTRKDYNFRGSNPPLIENIKPTRQLLCTFFSCCALGIHRIYNIYKFHAKQRTKLASLHSIYYISLRLSQITLESRTSYLVNDDQLGRAADITSDYTNYRRITSWITEKTVGL